MKLERILGRVFLMLISATIALTLIDRVSVYFVDSRSPIERQFPVENYRHPKPYVMFGGQPEPGGAETKPVIRGLELGGPSDAGGLNALGYRGPAPRTEKAPGSFRIFMLGGSTVVAGDPPIAALLEDLLQDDGIAQARVYNFGVLSSVSGMELARLLFEVSGFAPDLVIFYDGGNDILHPYSWDPRPGYPFNFIAFESNPLLQRNLDQYPSLAAFAFGSNILRWLFPSAFIERFVPMREAREQAGWGTDTWRAAIASIYLDNLIKADVVARAFGARFAAFFQPLIYFKPHLAAEEEPFVDPEKIEHVLDVRERIIAGIERAETAESATIIDLSGLYEDTGEWVFTDEIHTRQPSKPLAARAIYRHLRALDLLPPAAGPGVGSAQ